MDAVTALSGSGPAYVFHLTECMTEAGIAAGLPGDLAAALARATVAGSGELIRMWWSLAGQIAEMHPFALAQAKRAVNQTLDVQGFYSAPVAI